MTLKKDFIQTPVPRLQLNTFMEISKRLSRLVFVKNKTLTKPWKDAGDMPHQPRSHATKPKRIVSLVPSLTETLCALGGRDLLKGITAFCIRPVDLLKDERISKVGGTKRLVREKVLALKPDLILTNLEENELEDIDFFKDRVECYVNGVRTVAEGIETILELGSLIGQQDRARVLTQQATAAMNNICDDTRSQIRPALKIWYPIWRDPWMGIGEDTFIADHLRLLGAAPILTGDGVTRYPTVSLEEVSSARPDLIWLPSEPYAFSDSDQQELQALKGLEHTIMQRVNGDHICWFGYRQIEGLAYAAQMLWTGKSDIQP